MVEVEFRVLGPLEVSAAGEPLPLGGPKQRAILALLLLSANEVVPRERLIDDVWSEEPPPEVDASLRVYIARLRKILAAGNGSAPTLETYRNGYVLRIAPDTLDLNRFERLLASGSDALTAGRPAEASAELSEALGLWRGRALVDLLGEAWAQRESSRLEGLRLRALEERIEADLRVGRHAELVPELERLVAEEPHRERFGRQLMLALYRCGRQSDALQAYARARQALRDEFGLEPTRGLKELERQILMQDPTLDLEPAAGPRAPQRLPRRRRSALAPVVGAALAITLATTLLAAFRDKTTGSAEPVALEGNSVVVFDERVGTLLGEIDIGGRPSGIAIGFGSIWVGNRDDETLLRIDPSTRRISETIGLGAVPVELTVGGGSVWILSDAENAVLQVDPAVNDVVATIDLGETGRAQAWTFQIAFARGAVWVSSFGSLLRVDPKTHGVATTRFRDVFSIASTGPALWAVAGIERNRIRRLDPTGSPIRLDRVGAVSGLVGVAADERAVWTASYDGTLWRVDADTGRVVGSVPLRRRIAGVALTDRAVWIVTLDGHVLRADPETGRILKTTDLGVFPPYIWGTIAAGESGVWVAALRR